MAPVSTSAVALVLAVSSLAVSCGGGNAGAEPIKVTSVAFGEGEEIPERFSCEGDNVSPPLSWSGVPDGTAEQAVVISDPDAPGGIFYHSVLLGLDASRVALAEGEVPDGAVVGNASSDNDAYIGMCPPDGATHRYYFTVYALNRELGLPAGVPAVEAVAAIGPATVAEGRLTARFSR